MTLQMSMSETTEFVTLAKQYFKGEPLNIFDIGSFNACQAVELALAFEGARVLALEADPYNVSKCLETVKHCNMGSRVRVVNAALGPVGSPRIGTFMRAVGINDQCGSLLSPNGRFPQPMPTEIIFVPIVSSIDLQGCFGYPELLWMDVQGTELDFFRNSWVRPKMVWMEVAYEAYYHHQPLVAQVDKEMRGYGYQPVHRAHGMKEWFGNVCYLLKE